MKILLLGKNGQVGWELQRSLALLGEVVALDRAGAAGLCGDLADVQGLARTVQAVAPQVIVNAAAYTAVDKAESEPDLAHQINAIAPGVLAREARALGARLVHYSTDYVFSGTGDTPWREDDPVAPQSAYGHSKAEGEQAIAASGAQALVLRTSWVFGVHGGNFLKTMLKASAQREELKVVADQWGAPTPAHLIADVTAHALRLAPMDEGMALFHLAPGGATNWHAYASEAIAHAARLGWPVKAQRILPLATTDWPTPARRPANSRMDCARLEAALGLRLPHWQAGVHRVVEQLVAPSLLG